MFNTFLSWLFTYWGEGVVISFLLSVGLMLDSRPSKWSGGEANVQGGFKASVVWFIINLVLLVVVLGFQSLSILNLKLFIVLLSMALPFAFIVALVFVLTKYLCGELLFKYFREREAKILKNKK